MPLSSRASDGWLASHWVTGAGFMAAGLLAVGPLLGRLMPLGLFLIFLHTPAYMIHQVEEHTDDRFRRFTNDRVFAGRDVLRPVDILVINLPLVWGVNLAALYAAFAWGAGYGLVAPYTMLVNALAHLGATAQFKTYNPGLVTAVILFLPLGIAAIWVIGALADVSGASICSALRSGCSSTERLWRRRCGGTHA